MRSLASFTLLVFVSLTGEASLAFEPDTVVARATAAASIEVVPRAAILEPMAVLQFHVTEVDRPAEASIPFVAGARAHSESEVVVLIEPVSLAPGVTLSIVGGNDLVPGIVSADLPTPAARWVGSGLRTGRLQFQLRATPGTYVVPIRLRVNVL
jgi:hypothetical protein